MEARCAVAGACAKPAGECASEAHLGRAGKSLVDRLGAQHAGRVIRESGPQLHSDLLGLYG